MLCLSCVSATLLRDAAVYSDVVYCNIEVLSPVEYSMQNYEKNSIL
jgi:hypothetical protein